MKNFKGTLIFVLFSVMAVGCSTNRYARLDLPPGQHNHGEVISEIEKETGWTIGYSGTGNLRHQPVKPRSHMKTTVHNLVVYVTPAEFAVIEFRKQKAIGIFGRDQLEALIRKPRTPAVDLATATLPHHALAARLRSR